jgi:hypothetical protein
MLGASFIPGRSHAKLLADPVQEELDATAPRTAVNIKTLSVNK